MKLLKKLSDYKVSRPGLMPEWAKEFYLRTRAFGSARRALPDFLVIGAQKSGSTSLFNYIALHPKVLPSIQKELFYFNRYWELGEKWYRRYFPFEKKLKDQRMITGEGSTTYLDSLPAAERAHQLLPEAKILVVLRDPTERAISHYYHRKRAGREARQISEVFNPQTLSDWAAGIRIEEEDRLYLDRGCYADQLSRWREFYSKDSILVIEAEDLFQETRQTMDRTYQFLGLSSFALQDSRAFNEGQNRKSGAGEDAVRLLLKEIYGPANQRLAEQEGITFSG